VTNADETSVRLPYFGNPEAFPHAKLTTEELDRVHAAVNRGMDEMAASMTAGLYGDDAERRVYELRKSILGDEAGPPPNKANGLAAWLP
jgi:hypothetical protein